MYHRKHKNMLCNHHFRKWEQLFLKPDMYAQEFLSSLKEVAYKKSGYSDPNISIISNLKDKVNGFSSSFIVSAFYINNLS